MMKYDAAMRLHSVEVSLASLSFHDAVLKFLWFANKTRPSFINRLLWSATQNPVSTPEEFAGRIDEIQKEPHSISNGGFPAYSYKTLGYQELDGVYKFTYFRNLLRDHTRLAIELYSKPLSLKFTCGSKHFVKKYALEANPQLKTTLREEETR